MKGLFDWQAFEQMPIVGIMRGLAPSQARLAVEAAIDGGLSTIEVPLSQPEALECIGELRAALGGRINLGAGTVMTLSGLRDALAAGAEFIVTPVVNENVIRACTNRGVPVFPGAMTPTEIWQAWEMGASLVKLFPAKVLGPDFVRALRAPMPQVRLMPTEGVTLSNGAHYWQAGAAALGIGGELFSTKRAAAGDWDWTRSQATQFSALWRKVSSKT